MAVTYRLDAGILTIVASGDYTPAELRAQFLAALADPACPTPVGLMLDVRESTVLATRGLQFIQAAAESLVPYRDRVGARCAVVVSSDAQQGRSQLGAVYAERVGIEARVFRAMEEAVKWLKSPAR